MKETAQPKLYRFSLALECFLNWTPLTGWVLFLFHLQRPNAPVEFDEVRERTWLGFFLPPPVRDAGRKNHLGEQEEERRNNFVHPEKSFLQIIFDKVRECTWLGSSLWQKDLLFKAGLSCISENHLAIMRRRNSFWNVTRNARSGTRNLHCNKCSYQGRMRRIQYVFSDAKDWT